ANWTAPWFFCPPTVVLRRSNQCQTGTQPIDRPQPSTARPGSEPQELPSPIPRNSSLFTNQKYPADLTHHVSRITFPGLDPFVNAFTASAPTASTTPPAEPGCQ